MERTVAPAVAGDDRARAGQHLAHVVGDQPVVRCRHVEAACSPEQCEATAHAEADDTDLPSARRVLGEEDAARLDVAEYRPLVREQGAEGRAETTQGAAGGDQVGW